MVRAVERIYRDGKVELRERPEGLEAARVVVVFVSESPLPSLVRREPAVDELLAELKKGYHLGGRPYLNREELHDRNDRQ